MTALYVRRDSHYHQLGVDAYDEDRDARTATPAGPIVAHPPCRCWGKLKGLAKPLDRQAEMDMARSCVALIRQNGGVLEHPVGSSLWMDQGLPMPGECDDRFSGYTIEIDQYDFGHPCRKRTLLYIVGCPKSELPPLPEPNTSPPVYSIAGYTARKGKGTGGGRKGTKNASRKMREMTPLRLGVWLITVAQKCIPIRHLDSALAF